MKFIFSHGQESTPYGTKIKRLSAIVKKHGFTTQSIDYREIKNPDDRVKHLINHINENYNKDDKIILVGSSMGGYVSTVTATQLDIEAMFLLAPALYIERKEYSINEYDIKNTQCVVVHGYNDDIIPYNNSVKFGNQTKSTVHLINGDHRLNSSLEEVEVLFDLFLTQLSKE